MPGNCAAVAARLLVQAVAWVQGRQLAVVVWCVLSCFGCGVVSRQRGRREDARAACLWVVAWAA
jgi:hypothetical protein